MFHFWHHRYSVADLVTFNFTSTSLTRPIQSVSHVYCTYYSLPVRYLIYRDKLGLEYAPRYDASPFSHKIDNALTLKGVAYDKVNV